LIRRALATGVRAGNFSTKIDRHCTTCNLVENDSHLFFHCTFARVVWFSASPPLITSNLPQEDDGIQEIISILITPTTTDDDFHRILTILWYIWKARTDARFKNKKWTVLQVHHAVEADIRTATMNDDAITKENDNCVFVGGATNRRIPNADHLCSNQLMILPGPPNYKVSLPALLP